MSTERFNLICKNYPTSIQVANQRAKKYIKKGKALNKTQQKYLAEERYTWQERGTGSAKALYLYDNAFTNFVVSNPKVAGTPRFQPVKGQIFWRAGEGNEWARQAIKDGLRTYFVPVITRHLPDQIFTPKDYYIQLEYIFYEYLNQVPNQIQDYLNLGYVYAKVFEDVMVEMERIKDDGPEFLRGGYIRYVKIPPNEEARLEIKFHFCRNNERIT